MEQVNGEKNNLFDYFSRVNFNEVDLKDILNQIISNYNFKTMESYSVIETGYEDFNVFVETLNNKYVIKFFSNDRTIDNVNHYTKILDIISKQEFLSVPKIYKNDYGILGTLLFKNKNIYYYVMEYIEGQTIYELEKNIDFKTILQIVFDILKYNCVNSNLRNYLQSSEAKEFKKYDMWSYENFLEEYNDKKKYLNSEDEELIKPIVDYYKNMKNRYKNYDEKFKNLPVMPPYISAHNDFISTNIILDDSKKPYYIDFSVSSIALNFVDVAIFGCDTVLKKGITSKEYAKYLKIISYILYRTHIMEYNLYPTSVAVQHAIHILIANYYKVCEHIESEENDYFLNLGRIGIKYLKKENLLNNPVFNWFEKDGWYVRTELSEASEYSKIKKEINNLGLENFVEENIEEYFKLYNKNRMNDIYGNIKLDDLYNNGYDWLYSCIDNLKVGETLMAISFCNENEWNGEIAETIWTKLNIDALNRNVLMKRIFVYPDNKKDLIINNEDINKFVKFEKENLDLGFISNTKINEILREKIKTIYPGILVFKNEIAFIDNNIDPENRGYNIFDKKIIEEYNKIYDLVKQNCDSN